MAKLNRSLGAAPVNGVDEARQPRQETVVINAELAPAMPSGALRRRHLHGDQADSAAHAVVAAPPDTVQVAQGRARVFQALATLFANPEPFMIQIAGRSF